MTHTGTMRAGRWCACAAILTSLAAGVVAVGLAAPGRWSLVVVLLGALGWGLGGSIAVALTPTGRPSHPDLEETGAAPRIGVVMHLGGVPDEVARMTSAIAAASAPVVLVVPPGRAVPPLLDPTVSVVTAEDSEREPSGATPSHRGTADAVRELRDSCDAVLILSARAVPGPGWPTAAHRLAAGASWVVGETESLNRDRFGPTRRERLDTMLRRRAASVGVWCWEPDATLVRTSLLVEHPPAPGRPLGSWLRDRAASGLTGATVEQPLARRAVPVAAEGYWPDTTARQRAAAADLSDAALSARLRPRGRTVATGLALHLLAGWSMVLWLSALVLLAGGSPVRRGDAALAALLVGAALLRWLAPRLATATRPSPARDLVAALYALPGSLAATTSALSRRVHPARRSFPTRPLVWLALVATAAAASVVLTARPGDGVARIAAAVAAVMLVLLWVFTVRALIERSWQRVGFRIPLDLPAIVEQEFADRARAEQQQPRWWLVDGSPGGFGLRGPVTGLARSDEVTVGVPRPDGPGLVLEGTVVGRRHTGHGGHGDEVLGIELRAVAPGTAAWAAVLLEGASGAPTTDVPLVDEHTEAHSWGRAADQTAIGLAVVTSVTVIAVLALVVAGVQPLIIRSGSMEPTYSVGDLVLVTSEEAGEVRAGQVVTRFDAPEAPDSLTHRVQEVSREGDLVNLTTRGDANDNSERWSTPADRHVGVVVAAVPALGVPLSLLRTHGLGAVLVGLALLAMFALVLRARLRGRGVEPPSPESLTPSNDVPTRTATTSTGEAP